MQAPAGVPACFVIVAVVPALLLETVVEIPAPYLGCGILRRRPEEGIVRKNAETAIVVPDATRETSEPADIGGSGIRR